MVLIDREKCIGCGKCVSDCVAKNIEIAGKKACVKSACLQCGHCVAICSCDAVSIPDYDMDDVEPVNEKNRIAPEVFLSCVKARRSIRDFSDKKISEEIFRQLAEVGRYTATANNGQFHKYTFVQENMEELKKRVWDHIDNMQPESPAQYADYDAYKNFSQRRKENAADDFLFRNAPAVLCITSQRLLDAGMAAQNIEMMANTMGIGAMFNGFLVRIMDGDRDLKKWLGIENETICACMLLGYPKQKYVRTAPRKKADLTVM